MVVFDMELNQILEGYTASCNLVPVLLAVVNEQEIDAEYVEIDLKSPHLHIVLAKDVE